MPPRPTPNPAPNPQARRAKQRKQLNRGSYIPAIGL